MPREALDWDHSSDEGMDRRIFIQGVGLVSLGLFTSVFGGCESLRKQIENRPVRRPLRAGSSEVEAAITTYKRAVAAMRSLPRSDPRSWEAQAAIHGTVAGGFRHCQHRTPHFFSWHRAYLYHFEKICQELTGDESFGLPYWNWNQTPAIHSEFTAVGSPLRHPRLSTTVGNNSAFSDRTLNTMFANSNFLIFSDLIEGSPHGVAHVVIGRDMNTGGSPQDPIFWAHHCMVDYCWAKWNIELGNDNTNDQAWLRTSWDHFVDGRGNPATLTAGATILLPLLAYRYESSIVGSHPATRRLGSEELEEVKRRLERGADVRFEVKKRMLISERAVVSLTRTFTQELRETAAELDQVVERGAAPDRVFVNVEWAALPEATDFFVRVFLNRPGANRDTPTDDPHYAGSFAFFGAPTKEHGGHGKLDYLVDVTETLRELKANERLPRDRRLSVQLVAVPAAGDFSQPDLELVLSNVGLIVTPVLIRSE